LEAVLGDRVEQAVRTVDIDSVTALLPPVDTIKQAQELELLKQRAVGPWRRALEFDRDANSSQEHGLRLAQVVRVDQPLGTRGRDGPQNVSSPEIGVDRSLQDLGREPALTRDFVDDRRSVKRSVAAGRRGPEKKGAPQLLGMASGLGVELAPVLD
jgi:hypothetical protein